MSGKMKNRKDRSGPKVEVEFHNDQPGENAGEGRMMKNEDERRGRRQAK